VTPAEYCEDKTRGSGSSFFYSFLFLPEEKKRAMMALYAFCREVDDIADEVNDPETAMRKLQFWREEIVRAFAGKPEHPIGKELHEANRHCQLSEALFADIMDGMVTDIAGLPILKSEDLSQYCYRVAGAVGLLSIEIFGYTDRKSREFSTALGEALQLTNILRDVREDATRGRIYFPQEARIRFGVTDQDFKDGSKTPGMQALLEHYGKLADDSYAKALELLPKVDRKNLTPSLIMGAIYHAHLLKLRAAGFDSWRHNIRLSPIHKMWIAWRAWRYEKRAQVTGSPAKFGY